MTLNLMGKKRGMMQVFDENGHVVPCTVIELLANRVTQIKTSETDGYQAVQLGGESVSSKRLAKPMRGKFEKAGVEPVRRLRESRVENTDEFTVGQDLTVHNLAEIQYVDVIGSSKGKGFQGVVKAHGFRGGPASHGSKFHRGPGSGGMRSTPGRRLPGMKQAKRLGGVRVTVSNLKVVSVIEEDNVLIVKGAVPGPKGALITVRQAKKKPVKK